jgi:hypothetical protein
VFREAIDENPIVDDPTSLHIMGRTMYVVGVIEGVDEDGYIVERHGILMSRDGGENWELIRWEKDEKILDLYGGSCSPGKVLFITVDHQGSSATYHEIYKGEWTTNGEVIWEPFDEGIQYQGPQKFDFVYAGYSSHYVAATKTAVYKSNFCGLPWRKIESVQLEPGEQIECLQATLREIRLGVYHRVEGRSYILCINTTSLTISRRTPSHPGRISAMYFYTEGDNECILAGFPTGIFSFALGTYGMWERRSTGIYQSYVDWIKVSPNGELILTKGEAGLFLSLDQGKNWREINLPEEVRENYSIRKMGFTLSEDEILSEYEIWAVFRDERDNPGRDKFYLGTVNREDGRINWGGYAALPGISEGNERWKIFDVMVAIGEGTPYYFTGINVVIKCINRGMQTKGKVFVDTKTPVLWEEVSLVGGPTPEELSATTSFVVHPRDKSKFYLGITDKGVYEYIVCDGAGIIWRKIKTTVVPERSERVLVAPISFDEKNPSLIYVAEMTIYPKPRDGRFHPDPFTVFRADLSQEEPRWEEVFRGKAGRIAGMIVKGERIYLSGTGIEANGIPEDERVPVLKSEDGGRNWQPMVEGFAFPVDYLRNFRRWWPVPVCALQQDRKRQTFYVGPSYYRTYTSNNYAACVYTFTEGNVAIEDNFSLAQSQRETVSYPNPFNPECYIPLKAKGKMENVKCKIYNILGQLVREIECSRAQGFKSLRVYWNGRDSCGLEVPAGVYFYEIAGENVRRMVVLR